MKKLLHNLIFEGAELTGKSYLMNRVYDFLEKKYNKSGIILDGCNWFNCDVGIFGTEYGKFCIEKYTEIMEKLKDRNVLFEKLHLTDKIYNRLYHKKEINYNSIEKRLKKINAKIILCSVDNDKNIFARRIQDRLNLYPHYERILQKPENYLAQQKQYFKELKKTSLDYLIVNLTDLPNDNEVEKILEWLGETA